MLYNRCINKYFLEETQMKKLLTMLLTLVLAFSCLTALASCGETYTVKFSANGGSFEGGKTEIEIEADNKSLISEPDEPTRSGYRFEGWSTKENETDLWNFDKDKVTEDITLYAVWTRTSSGGSAGSENSASYTVKLTTKGGMPMADTTVYIWEDDSIVTSSKTDETGMAYFSLDKDGDYSVKLNVPKGYSTQSFYQFTNRKLELVLESSLLPAEYLDNDPTMELGDVMYDFTVTLTDGTKFTLSEALAEKDAVVINFWYDGCSACEAEFPIMNDIYFNYGDENGEGKYYEDIALVALSYIDTLEEVKSYKQYYGLDIDMGPDLGSRITSSFGIEYYPTTVVVDRYGVITLIEIGALTSERPWKIMFDHFRGDDYEQQLIPDMSSITPAIKPADEGFFMPSSEEIASAFEKDDLNLTYKNDDNEYSWPFIADELGGESVIRPSNIGIESSYSMLITTVNLKAGEVLAFDYFSSSEQGADRLYVIVDKQDICSISGVGTAWETCYAYVAEEDGEYQVVFSYIKDSTTNEGDDTVYMKNLRIVTVDDIDAPTYIYRDAATNADEYGIYQDYVEIFLGSDGYYHVGSETGPLLLADLLGYTLFKDDDYVYNMSVDNAVYGEAIEKYASYASNSTISGVVPVTEELRSLLKQFVDDFGYQIGGDKYDENEWLLLCCYYDAYRTNGKQLEDPIKGLATFSAYEAVEGGATYNGSNLEAAFPNSVTYDRVIMPRGLLFAFTPTVSGTYKITSYTTQDINAWIFRADDVDERIEWLVYDSIGRDVVYNDMNCYMMAYLKAGETYYIDIAFYDVYAEGTIRFRVDRLGGEGYFRFTAASPGYFTFDFDASGQIGKILATGIDVKYNETTGYWHESRTDGRLGSILYADFTQITSIFDTPIYNNGIDGVMDLINAHAFDFRRTEDDQYILNYIDKHYKDGATKEEAVAAAKAEMMDNWGTSYEGYQETYKIDEVCEIFLSGSEQYHGTGTDRTEEIRAYISKIVKVGSTVLVVNDAGTALEEVTITKEDDPMIGCVAVDENLADILQDLMDKYTFMQLDEDLSDEDGTKVYESVENSWRKLCYYSHYFCEATPK